MVIISSTNRIATPSISKSARAPRSSASNIPRPICWSCATTRAFVTRTKTAIPMSESEPMTFTKFSLDVDGDGIALITWNAPGSTMNLIDVTMIAELSAIVEQLAADAEVKGAVITSGKDTFCAGADLTMLQGLGRTFKDLLASQGEEAANARVFEESRKLSLLYRRIETCGKPFVAAI